MSHILSELANRVRPADLADIALMTVLLYLVLAWLRQQTSRVMTAWLLVLLLLYVAAHVFNLYLTSVVFHVGLTPILLILIVIFQQDIRRGFQRIAARWSRQRSAALVSPVTDALTDAISDLTERRVGALIVLEGRESTERETRGGVDIDGLISASLLASIFHPRTPTHDGAAIIKGDRIDRVAVHLPLTTNPAAAATGGTRHAAALGLVERSDALVVVVSEERGTVGIAEDGRLQTIDSLAEAKRRIEAFYEKAYPTASKRHPFGWLTANFSLKVLALFLAVLLWLAFGYRAQTVQRTYLVPIEYQNVPRNWNVEPPSPTRVQVTIDGPETAFELLDPDSLVVALDVSNLREGRRRVTILQDEAVQLPANLTLDEIEPPAVQVEAHALTTVELPVEPRLVDALPDGLELVSATAEPRTVAVSIPRADRERWKRIETAPIPLETIHESTSLRVELIAPDGGRLQEPKEVTVRIDVKARAGRVD